MPKNSVYNRSQKVNNYFTQSAIPSVRTYFGNVSKGNPTVYTTPFAKGESTGSMLTAWDRTLVSIRDEWPSLYAFETDMASKVGPMSVMKPLVARMDDIEDYYRCVRKPAASVIQEALVAVLDEWRPAMGMQVRGEKRTIDNMKLSSNSGSPYFTKRRNVVNETYPSTISWDGPEVKQFLPDFTGDACAVLGWRGQEGGYSKTDVKQRVVWMFPFAVNMRELQVYQPLIEAAQRFGIIPAWVSMDRVDWQVTKLFDTKSSNDLVICTDFTKFDQHFNLRLQNAVEFILRHLFNDSIRPWLRTIFPVKYNIPLMYDFGKVMQGSHGMGSGSGGTNADETLAHRALQYEVAIIHGAKLNPNSQCLGDDGVLTYPGITAKDVVDTYSKHGLEMNMSKQYVSTQDCIYLRRWHHQNYRPNGVCAGVYSTMRALGRLRYLERYQDPEYWSPVAVALRQLSILENVKYHPLRDQFAEFCMKRDKYRLGIDIPGFLDGIVTHAKNLMEHMPDFMGYTKTLQSQGDPTYGIMNWWIVQYLESKA